MRKKFDVFLSHNSQDKSWVIKLKDDLMSYDIKVWLDKDEIRPGDLFAEALEIGLGESSSVALIISPPAMESGWVKNEYYRALSLATNNQLQLIPVLYKKAKIPGFLQDRNWVDFSDDKDYTQSIQKLIWGITGNKSATKIRQQGTERSKDKEQTEEIITIRIGQIKNPFVRDMERRLRMENVHWVEAGFSIPANEFNFTSVYYQNQIEIFNKSQETLQVISSDITNQSVNLLQDSFLDMIGENLNSLIERINQVDELISSSEKDFELSLLLNKTGKAILRDINKLKNMVNQAPMKLLLNPSEIDDISDSLSVEIGNLAISVDEYQRYLSTILNQARLEKIYSLPE